MPLFTVILPVFALILLGKLIMRLRLVDLAGLKALTDIVFYIVLPALLFLSIAQHPASDTLGIAAAYFAVLLPCYALSLLGARQLLGLSLPQGAVFALNATFGNMGLLGVPIVEAAWGQRGLAVLLALIGFHSVIMLPLTTVLVELGFNRGAGLRAVARQTGLGLVRNPVILAIAAAYAWRLTGLDLPLVLARFLGLLAQAASPLALICVGASLPRLAGRAVWGEAMLGAAIKLAGLPLVVWCTARAVGLAGTTLAVMVLAAALPTGANAFMLARRAGTQHDSSASTVVIGTVLSVATLTVVLAALR